MLTKFLLEKQLRISFIEFMRQLQFGLIGISGYESF